MCARNKTTKTILTLPGTVVLHRTVCAALKVLTPPPDLPELLEQIPPDQEIATVTAPSRQICAANRLPGNGSGL